MIVLRRSVVFCLLLCFVEFYASQFEKYGVNIALLGYKQNIALRINKTHILSPILIIPVLIETPDNETGDSTHVNENKTIYLKLHENNVKDDDDDIDVGFRQSLNRGVAHKNKSLEDTKDKITVRQSVNENDNNTEIIVMNSTEKLTEENIKREETKNTTGVIETTMLPEGLYPNSNNSNKEINSISLTTTAPDTNLPPITDNRWQNFALSANRNLRNESSTKKSYSSTNRGPYSAALYNNGMIDQISITTNSYIDEESPLSSPKDDRWRTFTKNTQYSTNEFKPLAGLYYDGFLHKPLIMLPGFIPRKYYNLF